MNRYSLIVALALAGAPSLAAAAPAEAAPEAVPDDAGRAGGGDIVVTAQKRAESVQTVAATISVVSGDLIRNQTLDSAVDVARFAPNVNGWNNDGRSRPRYFIRGIGNGNVSNNAVGAVALSQDEVYLNSLVFQGFPLLDLERVEVLSGPQGTLQGKNATAGSIGFVSRKPSFTPDGSVAVSLGDYGQKQLELAAGGPVIGDTVAVRVAARAEKNGGYADNSYTGHAAGDFTDYAVRAQVLARPSDTVEILANVHYRTLDATRTPHYAAVQGKSAPLLVGDRDTISANLDSPQKLTSTGALLRLSAELSDALSLTAISGYEKGKRTEISDGDNMPRELSRSYSLTKPEQFSQEIRLANADSARLGWIAGGYFFHETLDSFQAQGAINAATGGTPGYYFTRFRQKSDSVALFGNLRYALTERLHLQGGLRWTRDTGSIDLDSRRALSPVRYVDTDNWWLPAATGQALAPIARQVDRRSWSRFTYDAQLRYEPIPGLNLYGRIANGYRAGNFQGQVSASTPPAVINPETLTSYEGGVKSSWLNGALVLNADIFYSKYKDIQISVAQSTGAGIIAALANAAGGYAKGAEVEVRARPFEGFSLSGNLGLLKTKFTSFTLSGATANIDGAAFARAPKVTASVVADYGVPTALGRFTLGTGWRYNSHFYFLVTDETSPALQQKGYAVGDLRLSWRSPSEAVELTAAVQNVTDKTYKVQVLPYQFASVYGYALGAPRTFLATARFRW